MTSEQQARLARAVFTALGKQQQLLDGALEHFEFAKNITAVVFDRIVARNVDVLAEVCGDHVGTFCSRFFDDDVNLVFVDRAIDISARAFATMDELMADYEIVLDTARGVPSGVKTALPEQPKAAEPEAAKPEQPKAPRNATKRSARKG